MTRNLTVVLVLTACTAVALGAASCGGEKAVKFGVVLPLTGQWDIYGKPIKQGIDLAFDQARASQATEYQMELDLRDSESSAQKAAEQLAAVYKDGAIAAIGGVTSSEALAMVPVMDKADKVLVSPSASSPRLTGISSNFFRVYPSDFREGSKMGNFAAQGIELNRVVIIGAESPYATGVQDVFKTEFERYGGEVPAVVEYPAGHTDFNEEVDKVLSYDPEAVYIADYAFEIGSIVKLLRQRGFRGKVLTTHAFSGTGVYDETGAAAEGVLLTRTLFDVDSDVPAVRSFVDAYRQKYGEDPDAFAAHGYDAFRVVVMALQEGGARSVRDFWKGMKQVKFEGASGQVQFDEKGDVGQFPRVYAVENGQLVDYEEMVDRKKKEILDRLNQLRRQAEAARRAGSG